MLPKEHKNSLINTLCYRISEAVIDPGDVWEGFEKVRAVLLTHAHFDHIYGINDLLRISPDAVIYTNEAGLEMLMSEKLNMSKYFNLPIVLEHSENVRQVNDGDLVDLGSGLTAKAVFTPGHNPSCISWIVDTCFFTGDSLIPGLKTVTNLPKSNKMQAAASEQLILQLADQGLTIYPGHFLSDNQWTWGKL